MIHVVVVPNASARAALRAEAPPFARMVAGSPRMEPSCASSPAGPCWPPSRCCWENVRAVGGAGREFCVARMVVRGGSVVCVVRNAGVTVIEVVASATHGRVDPESISETRDRRIDFDILDGSDELRSWGMKEKSWKTSGGLTRRPSEIYMIY